MESGGAVDRIASPLGVAPVVPGRRRTGVRDGPQPQAGDSDSGRVDLHYLHGRFAGSGDRRIDEHGARRAADAAHGDHALRGDSRRELLDARGGGKPRQRRGANEPHRDGPLRDGQRDDVDRSDFAHDQFAVARAGLRHLWGRRRVDLAGGDSLRFAVAVANLAGQAAATRRAGSSRLAGIGPVAHCALGAASLRCSSRFPWRVRPVCSTSGPRRR